MIYHAAGGALSGQGVSHLAGLSQAGLTVWGTEDCGKLSSHARSLSQGSPKPPTQPISARAITHEPFSTLRERTLRRPPRSQMSAQSLSSRQRRPWRSSSSRSVRQAGARPGAGALLMLRQLEGWDKVLGVSRALSLTQARPTGLGEGPGSWDLGWFSLRSLSPARKRPCPSTEHSPGR